MRKLIALAVVCTTALVFAAVAYATNVYTVTPASTKGGGGKGTSAKPVAKAVVFGFKTKDSGGGRATPIKRYKIGFQGLKYFGKSKVFPKCTIANLNQKLESDVKADCGKAFVGKGVVNNLVGVTGSPVTTDQVSPAVEPLQHGQGLCSAARRWQHRQASDTCPIAVNQSINAKFKTRKIGGKSSASLEFDVPSNLLHPGSPNISNAIETTTSTISGRKRKVKIKGKTRKVSILSSVSCGKSKRSIQVSFTDEKNSTVPAKASVKC